MPAGPYPVGVTTTQFDDHGRRDPDTGGPRSLQTEIWYPAEDSARVLPKNLFSEFLGRGVIPGSITSAEEGNAIGGYRQGLTIKELDSMWPNVAVRDAHVRQPSGDPYPLVIFSHGSGAYRASYIYWTEFLASHGFVVMACDHPGSARYTQIDGKVVKPGGGKSVRSHMESERPKDLIFLIDAMERWAKGADSRFTGRVDAENVALTGMSFGGYSTAAALEVQDPRVKAAVMKCPSLMSGDGGLPDRRKDTETPIMMMLGSEDTVIGEKGRRLAHRYVETHHGPKFLMEIKRGGHVSFTSCEIYNESYGNGIGESKSLSKPGTMYTALSPPEQHEMMNSYGLAFLDTYLRGKKVSSGAGRAYLRANHFEAELVYSHAF